MATAGRRQLDRHSSYCDRAVRFMVRNARLSSSRLCRSVVFPIPVNIFRPTASGQLPAKRLIRTRILALSKILRKRSYRIRRSVLENCGVSELKLRADVASEPTDTA